MSTRNNRGGFPNDAGAPVDPAGESSQAALDSQWWRIQAAANFGTGVITGGTVVPTSPAGLSVEVDAANCMLLGALVFTPTTVLTIAPNASAYRRFDVIVVRAGAVVVLTGVPNAIACFPSLASDPDSGELTDIALASVLVLPGQTSIAAEDITYLGVPPIGSPTRPAVSFVPMQTDAFSPIWSYGGATYAHIATFIQDNCVTTSDGDVWTLFVAEAKHLVLCRHVAGGEYCQAVDLSSLPGDPFETGASLSTDSHDMFSLGISPDGFVHISGNMHAQTLKYARAPIATFTNLATWTYPTTNDGFGHKYLSMVGDHEVQTAADASGSRLGVTYPAFVRLSSGMLAFLYRWGQSGKGDLYINRWNDALAGPNKWQRVGLAIDGQHTDTGDGQNWNAYPNKTMAGDDDDLHLIFCWRATGNEATNEGMYYLHLTNVASGTLAAFDSAGNAKVLPIQHDPAAAANRRAELTVTFAAPNLLNQGGACLDRDGYPHACVCFKEADSTKIGFGQYQNWHLWRDATGWHREKITDAPTGAGRNPIVAAPDGRIYIIGLGGAHGKPWAMRAWDVTPGAERSSFEIAHFPDQREITNDVRAFVEHGQFRTLIVSSGAWLDPADPQLDPPDVPESSFYNVVDIDRPRGIAGILTVDLAQMDAFKRGTVRLPGIKTVASLTHRDPTNNSPKPTRAWVGVGQDDGLPGPFYVIGDDRWGEFYFVRQHTILGPLGSGAGNWAAVCVYANRYAADGSTTQQKLATVWCDNTSDAGVTSTGWVPLNEFITADSINTGTVGALLWANGGTVWVNARIDIGVLDRGGADGIL